MTVLKSRQENSISLRTDVDYRVFLLLKIIFTGQKVIFPNLRDLRNLLKIIGSFPFYFISFYLFSRDRGIDNRINFRLKVIFSYISKKDDKEMKA